MIAQVCGSRQSVRISTTAKGSDAATCGKKVEVFRVNRHLVLNAGPAAPALHFSKAEYEARSHLDSRHALHPTQ